MDQMAIDNISDLHYMYNCNIPLQEDARDGDALRTDACDPEEAAGHARPAHEAPQR